MKELRELAFRLLRLYNLSQIQYRYSLKPCLSLEEYFHKAQKVEKCVCNSNVTYFVSNVVPYISNKMITKILENH